MSPVTPNRILRALSAFRCRRIMLCIPLLEPWRAPWLLVGALAGWAFFTVVVWGSVYYHLRTGAPETVGHQLAPGVAAHDEHLLARQRGQVERSQ